jgi:hypothetical protein
VRRKRKAGNLRGFNSPTHPRMLQAAAKARRAVALRLSGCGFATIARQIGYANKGGAYKAVQAAIEAAQHDASETNRKLELMRLDRLLLVVWPGVLSGDLEAIDHLLKISARRAKMEGWDAGP